MTPPKYIIKRPVYQYAKSYYYFEILDGKYVGLQFNFSELNIEGDTEDKKVKFIYNLLSVPEHIEMEDEGIELTISEILKQIFEENKNELDTK